MTIRGTDVFIRETPSERPGADVMVCVHGLGGASTNFTDVADLLSAWLETRALDLPGFGHSAPPVGDDYSLEAQGRIVIAYLERLARGPVHLVGNSMGGAIALFVAEERPDLVRTLTLISPAVPDLRPHKRADYVMPLLLIPVLGARALNWIEQGSAEERARGIIRLCFAHPERVPPNRLAEAAADIVSRRGLPWAQQALLSSLASIVRMYFTIGSRSLWRRMPEVKMPSLVIWGAADRLVDVSNAPRVAAALPDSELLVLADVGHTAQLEDPAMTARGILGLIRRADHGSTHQDVGA
jgi:pimeloyl-ACP methyl ester carboxylesterase